MDLVLLLARALMLVLMYAFLLVLIVALVADARAARPVSRAVPPVPVAAPAEPPAPQPAPATLRLEVLTGTLPVTGRQYALYGPLEIGRGTSCDISIPNRFVSTHHARIAPQGGAWMLEDLGSTNGTLVNGEPLDTPHRLAPGDRVLVGDTEFVVQ